ncbi:hypothetical protein F4680DRAFT_450215 [Xylaria scruposa]|nr:hypothetical protein F4680DRAFT_450215 [Xylaria scruposa]
MSSTSDNQPTDKPADQHANQPRVCNYIEGEALTKAEFLEFLSLPGRWDNDSIEKLLVSIEQLIPTPPEYVRLQYFEPLREKLLAEGKISNEQDEILKTVQTKIHATADKARVVKYTIEEFLEEESTSGTHVSTLHDELKRRVIFFLEQEAIQGSHIEWLENFACDDPLNIPEMIKDAQEFPMLPRLDEIPWNHEADEDFSVRRCIYVANILSEAAEQAEQGEQIE